MKMHQALMGMAASVVWLTASMAVGEEDFGEQLPRIPPTEPDAAVATIETLPGFRIEQVAAEPLVHSPVAMDFDENGRLFVVEMCDYSERHQDFLGRIRVLEDVDGDGKFEKSAVYAEGLSWPTAVICFEGGVFVGAAPHIYYLKDADGDGRAEEPRLVFTGFNRHNVQGLINSFRWGLDNRIHGATGTVGGSVTRPDHPDAKAVNLNGRDFSFDPRLLDLRPESGGGQHGMSFDDWGRKFDCNNSEHLQMVLYEDRYAARNPLAQLPAVRRTIAADGGQAEVFRLSPVEPWRILRTRLRVEGRVTGGVEGGGRPAGYFAGATGVTIYRGDAFPEEYRGQAFTGDVGSNLVHRKTLEPDGVALIGRRVDQGREFIASRDIWFRPAQFANAPDGAFYVADVYREVIEHPESIPAEIKKHLDLASGSDRGRIYRVVPDGFMQRALPTLGKASVAELVATLDHRNGWHRDVAARLLFERQDAQAVAPLRELLATASIAEGRLHALYALQGLGALNADDVLRGLGDSHPRVREHAVRVAEPILADSPEVRTKLCTLVSDPDLRVRYQLAWTLGEKSEEASWRALAKLAQDTPDVPLLQAAAASSLGSGGAESISLLLADAPMRRSAAGTGLLSSLAEQLGARANPQEFASFDAQLATLPDEESANREALVRALISGAQRSGHWPSQDLAAALPRTAAVLDSLVASSRATALDELQSPDQRVAAIRALGLGQFSTVMETLAELLAGRQPQEVQLAAVEVLGKYSDADVAKALLDAWPGMTPRVRTAAADALLSRLPWLLALMERAAAGEIAVSELDATHVAQLTHRTEPEIRQRVEPLLSKLQVGPREDVLQVYRASLELPGDASRGRAAFEKTCAACHRLEGVGHEIGPNLAAMKNRGAEAILLNVIDPNREVNPQYVNYVVMTVDGRALSGMISAETASNITLRRSEDAADTVLRSDIEELRSTGQSIMPEGLEKQIDPQAMADLIAYLMTVDDRAAAP